MVGRVEGGRFLSLVLVGVLIFFEGKVPVHWQYRLVVWLCVISCFII